MAKLQVQLWLVVLALCAFTIVGGGHIGQKSALKETRRTNAHFNHDTFSFLERTIERSRILNYALANSAEVIELAAKPPELRVSEMNRHLADLQRVGAKLVDSQGIPPQFATCIPRCTSSMM